MRQMEEQCVQGLLPLYLNNSVRTVERQSFELDSRRMTSRECTGDHTIPTTNSSSPKWLPPRRPGSSPQDLSRQLPTRLSAPKMLSGDTWAYEKCLRMTRNCRISKMALNGRQTNTVELAWTQYHRQRQRSVRKTAVHDISIHDFPQI